MFVASGVGPCSGQSVHFRHHATEKISYATNRYLYKAERHYGIINARLAKQRYMLGDTYTIVDMCLWGWARMVPYVVGDDAWTKFPDLKRFVDEINARPAAQKAATLKDRFTFKAEMDDEARSNMFRHLQRKAELSLFCEIVGRGEHRLGVARHSHFAPAPGDAAALVDQERRTLDAHELSAVHRFLDPHAIGQRRGLVRVSCKANIQAVLLAEFLVTSRRCRATRRPPRCRLCENRAPGRRNPWPPWCSPPYRPSDRSRARQGGPSAWRASVSRRRRLPARNPEPCLHPGPWCALSCAPRRNEPSETSYRQRAQSVIYHPCIHAPCGSREHVRGKADHRWLVVTVDGKRARRALRRAALHDVGLRVDLRGRQPEQLALALLIEHLKDNARAIRLAEPFMRSVVANLDNDWVLQGATSTGQSGRSSRNSDLRASAGLALPISCR